MADNSAASSLEQENQWGCTELKVSKCRYTWTIKTLECFRNNKLIWSPTFHVGGNNGSKWNLKIYPDGYGEQYKEFCSLYLHFESCLSTEVEAKFKFSMLTPGNDREAKDTFQKERSHIFKPGNGGGFHDFIRRDILLDEAEGFIHGDKFTIVCEMNVVEDPVKSQSYVAGPKCQLLENFEILLENGNFSDVTLAAGDCEYHVHKAILAARSNVFAGMFTHDMEESRSNRVNIPDIGGDVCKEMLHFIYTDKAPNLDKWADGLLAAADKYELIKLKALCEEALALKLSAENVTATLLLADLHSADQLKAQTVNFIGVHALDVYQTEGWKKMSSSNLPLMMETLLAIEKSKTRQTNSNK